MRHNLILWITLFVSLLSVFHVEVPGQDARNELDRFELFNNCEPMRLVVEELYDDETEIGLTEERLRFVAESRLRAARLYTADRGGPFLYVKVNVVGPAFSASLEYRKRLLDSASGVSGMATTWDTGATGTHGQDAAYIVTALSGFLDRFLTEYLRVNEKACGGQ